jgi:ParB family transcriptional regulator, chromosome partitioning protein
MAAPKSKLGASSQIFNRPAAAPAANGAPAKPAGGIVAALQGGSQPGAVLELELAQIAEHPDNPRNNLGDIDGLAASIGVLGVLSPILVVPAAAFLADHPEHVDHLGGAEYVLAAGHRRLAAARKAGLERMPALIKPTSDKITTYVTFIDENMHRAGLDPIEEARGYQLLRDAGLTQKEVAERLRISQPQVSKRLSLLKLPQSVQDALTAGEVSVAEALALTAIDENRREAVWEIAQRDSLPIERADMRQQVETEQVAKKAAAAEQAAAEGIELIDPHALWPTNSYNHRLYDHDKAGIKAAREAGTLRGHATGQGLAYYQAKIPKRQPTAADKKAAAEKKARKEATAVRQESARRYVQTAPSETEATAAIISAHLTRELSYYHSEAVSLVHAWLFGKFPHAGAGDSPRAWIQALTAGKKTIQTHVGWALTVAIAEIRTGYGYWDDATREYLQNLIDHADHTPSQWEAARLTEITED